MLDPTPAPPQGEGFSAALAAALRLLKVTERTASEIRAALLPKHGEGDTQAALDWLAARGLLSERRAAEATVRPRSSGRRAEGDDRLRQRLEARGATPEAIEEALAQAPEEAQRMRDALATRFRPDDPAQRGKAGRFLLSRGFEEEAVDAALDRFFGEG